MKRAACVVCLLVATSVLAGGFAAADARGAASAPPLELTQQDFDRTEFGVTVYANGSARWTFTFSRSLTTDDERTAFEDYADRFNSEKTELYTNFVNRAENLTAKGSSVTGREMTAASFSKRAFVDEGQVGTGDERGIVRMSFTWTAFARTSGDRVIVADVFDGGFYIGPNQSLVFRPGPELAFAEATPAPDSQSDPESLADSDSVTYVGEQSFADQRPRIVFAPPGQTPGGGDGTSDGTSGGTPTDGGAGVGLGAIPWLALAAVLLLGFGAAYVYRTGTLNGGVDDAGEEAAAAASTPEISDEELMSDEDRVISMLEERGGRMKQVKIVEETGWSKSKVSMLLSDMEEEGRVSKLRVGRENIVSLAGEEPEAAGSPFDDEESED